MVWVTFNSCQNVNATDIGLKNFLKCWVTMEINLKIFKVSFDE